MLIDENELAALAARYGDPLRWARTRDVSAEMMGEREKALKKKRGEIVLVIPRPHERVLVHTKSFYPSGAYRLLSGGIELGEGVDAAAQREIREETSLSIQPVQFMGMVEYAFRRREALVNWVSYVFLTEQANADPIAEDTSEEITDFRDIDVAELGSIADRLEQLPAEWQDWGWFRSVPHRLAAQVLLNK